MATTFTAEQLHEYRTYLHNKAVQAAKSAKAARNDPEAEFNRGRRLAYSDAVVQLDEMLADIVTIALLPDGEGPQ